MRRFWHPVACSRDVTTRPKKVRILNEDLILFRDGCGRPGLLYPRCAHRDRVRQPWYHVEELYGLVFAYMGPPEKKPLLTRWDILEDIAADEEIVCFGPMAVNGETSIEIMPWNWLADFENTMDPHHVRIRRAPWKP